MKKLCKVVRDGGRLEIWLKGAYQRRVRGWYCHDVYFCDSLDAFVADLLAVVDQGYKLVKLEEM